MTNACHTPPHVLCRSKLRLPNSRRLVSLSTNRLDRKCIYIFTINLDNYNFEVN